MGIPNVGVGQVIQDPGLGGALGKSYGDLSTFLRDLEKGRQDDANEKARIALLQRQQDMADAAAKQQASERAMELQRQQAIQQAAQGFLRNLTSPQREASPAVQFDPGKFAQGAGVLGAFPMPVNLPAQAGFDPIQSAVQGAGQYAGPLADQFKELLKQVQGQQADAQKPFDLAPGAKRFSAKGKVVGENAGADISDPAGEYALFVMGLPPTTKGSDLGKNPAKMKQFQELANSWRRSGAPGGVTVNLPGQSALDTGLFGGIAEQLVSGKATATAADNSNRNLDRALGALTGGARSGPGATPIQNIDQLAVKIFGKDGATSEATSRLEAALAQNLLDYAATRPLGGQISLYEVRIMEKAKQGKIDLANPVALMSLLRQAKEANDLKVSQFQQSVAELPQTKEMTPEWKAYFGTVNGKPLPDPNAPPDDYNQTDATGRRYRIDTITGKPYYQPRTP